MRGKRCFLRSANEASDCYTVQDEEEARTVKNEFRHDRVPFFGRIRFMFLSTFPAPRQREARDTISFLSKIDLSNHFCYGVQPLSTRILPLFKYALRYSPYCLGQWRD